MTKEKQEPSITMTGDQLRDVISGGIAAGIEAAIGKMNDKTVEKMDAELTEEQIREIEDAKKSEMQRQLEEPHFLVTISKSDRKDAITTVPLNVNGIQRNVVRGDPTIMVACMIEVLANSVETTPNNERDDKGFATGGLDEVQCYPYTVHCEIPREEWDWPLAKLTEKYIPARRTTRMAATQVA